MTRDMEWVLAGDIVLASTNECHPALKPERKQVTKYTRQLMLGGESSSNWTLRAWHIGTLYIIITQDDCNKLKAIKQVGTRSVRLQILPALKLPTDNG